MFLSGHSIMYKAQQSIISPCGPFSCSCLSVKPVRRCNRDVIDGSVAMRCDMCVSSWHSSCDHSHWQLGADSDARATALDFFGTGLTAPEHLLRIRENDFSSCLLHHLLISSTCSDCWVLSPPMFLSRSCSHYKTSNKVVCLGSSFVQSKCQPGLHISVKQSVE